MLALFESESDVAVIHTTARMVQKDLFGGAIVAELPENLVDVSYVFDVLW